MDAFKTIFLEGKECVVTLANGRRSPLHAGQEVVVLPGRRLSARPDNRPPDAGGQLGAYPRLFAPAGFPAALQVVIDGQKAQVAGGTNGAGLLTGNTLDHNTQQDRHGQSPFRKTNISSNTNRAIPPAEPERFDGRRRHQRPPPAGHPQQPAPALIAASAPVYRPS